MLESLNFFTSHPELQDAIDEEVPKLGYRNSPAFRRAQDMFEEHLARKRKARSWSVLLRAKLKSVNRAHT